MTWRHSWSKQAACLDEATWPLFYPEKGEPTTAAQRICWEVCPVRESCLEWALAHNETHGVWGGLSARERRERRQLRRRAS